MCNARIRATLLLVPLLGMQYILTPFKPEAQNRWEIVYEMVSAFTASFQVKGQQQTPKTYNNNIAQVHCSSYRQIMFVHGTFTR